MITRVYINKFSFILIIIGFFCSCGVNNNPITVVEYSDSIQILPSPKEPNDLILVQPSLAFGKIIQPQYSDSMKAEQNLISQMSTYISAMINGNIQTCCDYLYPDALTYFRKYYPGFSDEFIKKEIFKEIGGDMQDMMIRYAEHGIEIDIIVTNLVRKIQIGQDVIIVFNTTSNIFSESVYAHIYEKSRNIAISKNGGINWYFLADYEDTPTILRMHYSQDVVNKVMGFDF